MTVKRFSGRDIATVLAQVREELGKDAIIVANHATEDYVQIIASADIVSLEQSLRNIPAVPPAPLASGESANSQTHAEAGIDANGQLSSGDYDSGLVHDMFGQLLSTGKIELSNSGRLLSMGLGVPLVRQLMEKAGGDDSQAAIEDSLLALAERITVKSLDVAESGGICLLYGPAGSGKTTVIGKLAAACVKKHSASKVAIINANQTSVGSDSKLATIGSTLGIPVLTPESEGEIEPLLQKLRRRHLVLIDTPALPPAMDRFGHYKVPDLTAGGSKRKRLRHLLIMPASVQASVMDYLYRATEDLQIDSVILTKVDETGQLGIAIDSLIRSGQKLSCWSDNMNLDRPLQNVSAEELVARAHASSGGAGTSIGVPAASTTPQPSVEILIDPASAPV